GAARRGATARSGGRRGRGAQPGVLDGRADREVVQDLEAVAGQAEQGVGVVVDGAADARAPQPGRHPAQVVRGGDAAGPAGACAAVGAPMTLLARWAGVWEYRFGPRNGGAKPRRSRTVTLCRIG